MVEGPRIELGSHALQACAEMTTLAHLPWCIVMDLNHRHPACKAGVRTPELTMHCLADPERLERPTPWFVARYSDPTELRIVGAFTWARTTDHRVINTVLYLLSYECVIGGSWEIRTPDSAVQAQCFPNYTKDPWCPR